MAGFVNSDGLFSEAKLERNSSLLEWQWERQSKHTEKKK